MNILILTTIYSHPDDAVNSATTPVVHNFAKEWVKMGHRVVVIHNFNTFPRPLYHTPRFVQNAVSDRLGFKASLNPEQRKPARFKKDGVTIYRVPILKVVPMGSYSEQHLKKQFEQIMRILDIEEFVPDLAVGHTENPQIWQLYYLKKNFKNIRTAIVFHGLEYLQRKKYETWRTKYFESIDAYGFRCKKTLDKARKEISFHEPYFMCPSGVADEYVTRLPEKKERIRDIIFVGQLIERKHAATVIEALGRLAGENLRLTIIGTGSQDDMLKKMARDFGLNVRFLGKKPHEAVLSEMRFSDLFIMVSEDEVFGLVYLEALSQGCITIASKNEGMEGIIVDGENGFLCKAGDTEDLVKKLEYILKMEKGAVEEMRVKGFVTAKKYSESAVAEEYLKNVIGRNV